MVPCEIILEMFRQITNTKIDQFEFWKFRTNDYNKALKTSLKDYIFRSLLVKRLVLTDWHLNKTLLVFGYLVVLWFLICESEESWCLTFSAIKLLWHYKLSLSLAKFEYFKDLDSIIICLEIINYLLGITSP